MGKRIGIFGGTFSPPHKGHIHAAESAAKQLCLDELLLIPTACPPHKEMDKGAPGPELRLEMLRLAAEALPFARVSDLEIRRGGKSYTVDTVRQLRGEYPDAELFLLMGGDMILSFEKWFCFQEILKEVTLAPFARTAEEAERVRAFGEELAARYGAKVAPVRNDAVEISSTALRELFPRREGLNYVQEPVYAFIVKNGLYGVKPDYAWLREKSQAWLDKKRIPHVLGCEEEAVRLAARWGVDEDEARTAAILHDITKKFDLEAQLLLCEKYDIITDALEKEERKLLHSKTGAGVAKYEFGASDAVFSAITWHTTGRADMSLLEKVIYMADYIEPTRDFDGVEPLRAMSYQDLDKALIMGLQMSIDDMTERGILPHPRTREALAFLLESKGT